MSSKFDDLEKLAELKNAGTISEEEFSRQKAIILNAVEKKAADESQTSSKSRLVATLLCFFFGIIGVHRFYVGKTGSGIAQIFTLGGLGIWTLVDFIMIVVGTFKDHEGKLVLKWE